LVGGTVNNKANNFVTSGNAVLRFEAIKYFMPELLLHKNSSDEQK
jgi:hypothetical protein